MGYNNDCPSTSTRVTFHLTCSARRRVVKIDWHLKSLRGPIPTEIATLSAITSLSLSFNNLTGQIPVELGNLTALESLGLSNNQLTGEIPSALARLEELRYMNLHHNNFKDADPQRLQNKGPIQAFMVTLLRRDRKRARNSKVASPSAKKRRLVLSL